MRQVLRVMAFASLAAGGTVAGGWWTVPALAAIWARVLPSDRRPVRTAILGAALSWTALLGLAALHDPVSALAACLSGALDLPRWGLLAVTALFPSLLAGAAAVLVKPGSIR